MEEKGETFNPKNFQKYRHMRLTQNQDAGRGQLIRQTGQHRQGRYSGNQINKQMCIQLGVWMFSDDEESWDL